MLLLLLALQAAPAKATPPPTPFEGVLEYKLALQGGSGASATAVSPLGVRSTARLTYLDKPAETTVLVRAKDPDVAWVLQPGTQKFVATPRPPAPRLGATVKPSGAAEVAGVKATCAKVSAGGAVTEYCTAPGFLGSATTEALVTKAQQLSPEVEELLRSVNAWGLVVRMTQTSADGKVATGFELVKVTRQKMERALFDVP